MIRVGILGTARIAPRILDRPASGALIDAVASRDPAKAREFAAKYGIPRAYGSYEELLGDPSLDAVYMPLPQHLHCEFTVKAAAAGKHVLVEKPAAMSVAEVRRMEDACTAAGVLYMEAFMYRFMRVHQRAREIAQSGTIGKIRRVVLEWAFNFGLVKRSAFKFDRSLGGGALYDLGIYGIDFLRFITGDEPRILRAVMQRRSGTGIDEYTRAEFMLGDVRSEERR